MAKRILFIGYFDGDYADLSSRMYDLLVESTDAEIVSMDLNDYDYKSADRELRNHGIFDYTFLIPGCISDSDDYSFTLDTTEDWFFMDELMSLIEKRSTNMYVVDVDDCEAELVSIFPYKCSTFGEDELTISFGNGVTFIELMQGVFPPKLSRDDIPPTSFTSSEEAEIARLEKIASGDVIRPTVPQPYKDVGRKDPPPGETVEERMRRLFN